MKGATARAKPKTIHTADIDASISTTMTVSLNVANSVFLFEPHHRWQTNR